MALVDLFLGVSVDFVKGFLLVVGWRVTNFTTENPTFLSPFFIVIFCVCVCVSLSLLLLFSVSIVGARTYEGKKIKPTSFCVCLPCKKKQLVVIHRCLGAGGERIYQTICRSSSRKPNITRPNSKGGKISKHLFINKKKKQNRSWQEETKIKHL